ncbi:MAG: flagellar motor switch protein FliM [Acidobacteriota bacterium]|nr:flagellar motor switch protein FliM [Acidobacteriota bacterium]
MGKILSQDEIDALLAVPGSAPARRPKGAADGGAIRYNFRRPDRVSKEQIHSLHFLHDRFARNMATSLSAYLRSITELSVVSVEQFAYSEFLASLADPTAFYALSMSPLDELGALEINPVIAFAMIDRMLGGAGRTGAPARALTDIEQHVADSVVKILLESLSETWRPIVNVTFEIRGRDTRPQMLQVAAPNETVLMVVFDMSVGDARGMVNLCLPATIVETAGGHFARAWHRQRREPTAIERQWVHEHLSRIVMPVSASIESRLTTRDLLDIKRGDIVSLGVPTHRLVDVHVGRTLKFKGHMSVDEGRLGVHIEQQCGRVPRTES